MSTGKKDKLLLVEDDALVAEVVVLALPELDVQVASTRDEAFRYLLGSDAWCGVLVDLNLTLYNDFRGKDVLEYLNGTEIPRAVLTGAKGIGDIRKNFEERYGVSTVVIKGDQGIELSDIRSCVDRMRQSSLKARREAALETVASMSASRLGELASELKEFERLRGEMRKVAGRAATEKLVTDDEQRVTNAISAVKAAKDKVSARILAATSSQGIRDALGEFDDEPAI